MIEIFVLLCLLPVAAVCDVVYWLRRAQTQGDLRANELAIASHGGAFLGLAALGAWIMGPAKLAGLVLSAPAAFPEDWQVWVPAVALVTMVVLGLYWALTGGARSMALAGDRDARFITRALLKIATGAAFWWFIWHPLPSWPRDMLDWIVYLRTLPAGAVGIMAVTAWLVVTGLVRFLLVALPAAASAEKIIGRLLRQRNAPVTPARARRG
jgi:hypothetical protein